MAQPPMSNSPPLQVPDKRDEMVVSKGASVDTPNLTVIAGHPSHAPTNLPSAHVCEREFDGSSRMPGAERLTGALCFDSIKSISSNNLTSDKDLSNLMKGNLKQSTTLANIPLTNDKLGHDDSFKNCDDQDYDDMRAIASPPPVLRLRGGGESSLTGTAGWGSPPAAQSGSTGWNGGSSAPPSSQPGVQQNNTGNNPTGNPNSGQPQNWGQGNNNNNTNANNNPNNNNGNRVNGQNVTGAGQQAGGPPSQNQAPAPASVPNSAAPTNTQGSSQANGNAPAGNNANPVPQQPGPNGPPMNQSGPAIGPQTAGNNPQAPSSGNNGPPSGNAGSSWAQAAGKGLPVAGQGSVAPNAANATPTQPPTSSTSTKQQMEQLNTMREALYSQDGWGGQNVNQDSSWDVPGSPEPGGKEGTTTAPGPMWKVPINNGTDLWEANLRNGGNPPPQNTTQKAPWGHTPSNNIGGTWGEEDEGDASNVWTGVPPAPAAAAPQWPNQPPPIWPSSGVKKEGEWSGPNWNEPRDPRDLRHGEMRQIIEARENMRPNSVDHRSMGGNEVLMRGDPRGISGRLNGVSNEAMWTAPGPHLHMPHHHAKLPNQPNHPGVNQWASGGGPQLKELPSVPKPNNGWEEPSPPVQRRNMPNYDDGTSLWGSQQHARPAMQGQNKVSHWKEMPTNSAMGRGIPCPPNRNSNMKPDQPLWPHHPRNNGWPDGGGMVDVGGPWADEKPAPWMEPALNPSWVQGGPKHKPAWDGSDLDPSSWGVGHPNKQQSKQLSKEVIYNSKAFRMLTDMGYKKEEVENALRASSLNLEEALEQLNASRNLGDRWRHSDIDSDHGGIINAYSSPQPPIIMPFQSNGGGGGGAGGAANVLANANPSLSTLSPAIMQKILSQQPPAPPQQQPPFAQSSRAQQTQQPSPQQLRMLVQQIQMAVTNGFLSPQILNQPLAPQTLLLLNQLLQQIKQLQQLQGAIVQHHQLMSSGNGLGKPSSSSQVLQMSVQITKTKQQITNLQNQIAAQQAVYVKHAQQAPPTDFFNKHEPNILHQGFSDLSLKDTHSSSSTSQQSRLNQWKLPDKDNDIGSANPDFSRAPGTTAKPNPGNSSPNINPLLGPLDGGTWSSVNRNNCDTGWPDSGADDNSSKDWPSSSQPSSQGFSDLVPEFEPGKPWKGNPIKSIEDDPSLTPGSVMPSPLSIPSLKDTLLTSSASVQGKASPTSSSSLDLCPPMSLTSSTWSFNPSSSSTSGGGGKLSGVGKSGVSTSGAGTGVVSSGATWSDANSSAPGGGQVTSSSELWAPPKRPPPGLPAKPGGGQGGQGGQPGGQASNGQPTANGWLSSTRWGGPQNSWSQLGHSSQVGSTWLLLRNLTPQIDGSTLRTLCLQHGPLQKFHLYLNHGIALVKYASREEANKAQGALNNCVLGNTTIYAENPSEGDVNQLLQHLGHSAGGSQNANQGANQWRQQSNPEPSYGQGLWAGAGNSASGAGATSLWGDSDQHRATPSSINSFLPGDLLGGESM
ncbi:Trinucleotide repeat containing 6C [Nesidiocoris tenuis]|uniref:Trinucleotide repeat containing 6C n=2 Tax=Nesidiocoris tenuis TaxID=355587 RepID=A0ABN7B7E9_9HEMI|nr:Trinucleotide repeat containing 6C [Nesidiocoris tenuis]